MNFKTKVVLHSTGTAGQKYTTVNIGDMSSAGKHNGAYWHFAYGRYVSNKMNAEYYYEANLSMYLATQKQTAVENVKLKKYDYACPEEGLESYKSVVGHELGHNLGLADGYKVGNLYRTVFSKEIGPISKGKANFKNIMYGSRKWKANANDIEMALQAQGMAIREEEKSWQSYKTYKYNGVNFYKSKVIRLK